MVDKVDIVITKNLYMVNFYQDKVEPVEVLMSHMGSSFVKKQDKTFTVLLDAQLYADQAAALTVLKNSLVTAIETKVAALKAL